MMTDESDFSVFGQNIAVDTAVTSEGGDGALVLKLDEAIAKDLGFIGKDLTAARVVFDNGQGVLLLTANTGHGPFHVTRRGTRRLNVVMPGADDRTAGEADLEVDDLTAAFLLLKQALLARGALDLSGPITADDFMSIGAEQFEDLERLLKK